MSSIAGAGGYPNSGTEVQQEHVKSEEESRGSTSSIVGVLGKAGYSTRVTRSYIVLIIMGSAVEAIINNYRKLIRKIKHSG